MAEGQIQPGFISIFAGEVAKIPAGHLPCDGRVLNSAQNGELYAAIGTTWGNGDGSAGSFHLPDLGGYFLRGFPTNGEIVIDSDNRRPQRPGAGGPSGKAVGSIQDDGFKSHTHSIRDQIGPYGNQGTASNVALGDNRYVGTQNPNPILSEGGKETRPINAYVIYIIKL